MSLDLFLEERNEMAGPIRVLLLVVALHFYATALMSQTRFSAPRNNGDVRLSVFQPIPGFWSEIDRIQSEQPNFNLERDWFPFFEGEIWMIFVKNELSISNIPPIARDAFLFDEAPKGEFGHKVVATVDRERQISFLFFFVEQQNTGEPQRPGCLAATMVYLETVSVDNNTLREAYDFCFSNITEDVGE